MKRPLTLTSCILNIVSSVVYLGYQFVISLIIFDLLGSASQVSASTLIMIALLVSSLVIALVCMIFNIVSTFTWNKTPEKYKSKKKLLTVTLIFNFLFFFLILIRDVLSIGAHIIVDIILLVVVAVSNVLLIVDLTREKKKVARLQNEDIVSEQYDNDTENVEDDKIKQLNQMKEQGLITEEEYQEVMEIHKNQK